MHYVHAYTYLQCIVSPYLTLRTHIRTRCVCAKPFGPTFWTSLRLSVRIEMFGPNIEIVIWTYIHTYMHAYMHAYIHTNSHYIYIHVHTYMHTYMQPFTQVCIHTCNNIAKQEKHRCQLEGVRARQHTIRHAPAHKRLQTSRHKTEHHYCEALVTWSVPHINVFDFYVRVRGASVN